MGASILAPTKDLARVADAQRRFNLVIASLDDAAARRPSLLPGWTVGHLLTHVARNAASHIRRAEAAGRGKVVEQYAGGLDGRAAEIEAGAIRPARELIADVQATASELAAVWDGLEGEVWSRPTLDALGRQRPVWRLVGRRWQELEVHVVDLDLGVTYEDWPDEFVAARLPDMRAELPRRLDGQALPDLPPSVDERTELAWLYGRARRDDLPPLPPWG